MQTTIYLIRHGEVHNPDGILYYRLPNFGLSEKGKKEIEKTAEFLKDKHIDAIYSSSLHRARQSAEIIQKKLAIPSIQNDDEIIEVSTSYQGRKLIELDELQSEVYLKPLSQSDETMEQISHRMLEFIKSITKKYSGKSIVAVSHGDPIMILRAAIEKRPLELNSIRNGKNLSYIQHGEVYQITADESSNLSLTSVFQPVI